MTEPALFEFPDQPMSHPEVSHAHLSADGLYRYSLYRRWVPTGTDATWVTFVMLNPSTADAEVDDPTIRRCKAFARAWGYGGLHVVNLYAYRATKPRDLWTAADPVGPRNDDIIRGFANTGWPMVAAWGANARPDRVEAVLRLLGTSVFQSLGVTKDGHPRHPLYVKGDTPLTPWPVNR